jgi:hypothetical protein
MICLEATLVVNALIARLNIGCCVLKWDVDHRKFWQVLFTKSTKFLFSEILVFGNFD